MTLRPFTAAPASIALAALVLACGAGTRPPAPTTVLADAGAAVGQLRSAAVDIGFGPGLSIDELELFSGTALVDLPGESDATFRVRRGDLLVDVRVIGAGGRRCARIPPSPFSELMSDAGADIRDHRVRRAVLAGPLREAGQRFRVELRLHDFDSPLNLSPAPCV